ncbi:MAG: DUF58 domain-containing protein [Actinobacteria bacterium]|nr:DUF58 domain-containing protein [Actinomycetota bacterium]
MSAPLLLALALGAVLVLALGAAPLTATRRTGLLLVASGLVALPAGAALALLVASAVLAAFAVDATLARRTPIVRRTVPSIVARGVASTLTVAGTPRGPGRLRVRQPQVSDIVVEPPEADSGLDARLIASRRGRHTLPAVAARVDGPLGLASWYREGRAPAEVVVYPDVPAARRLALAVRRGRFGNEGRRTRGPLGLGTDFESIRDYLPDDDVRRVNWPASQRAGRPMTNQYRLEQDRDVICLADCGRLMGSPLGDRTRLDAAVDAITAVALVADEVGDRVGVIAFDDDVRRHLPPRRAGGDGVVRAIYDLEPSTVDADYERAFRLVGSKRSFVLVVTDVLEEAAAQPLVDAVPVLARRHAVVVAGAGDPDLDRMLADSPSSPADVYTAAVALDVLDARARVTALLRHAGADVVDARPDALPAACVAAYLRAKSRARL